MSKHHFIGVSCLLTLFSANATGECLDPGLAGTPSGGPECAQLEPLTIFGTARTARDVAGGASVLTPDDLETFATSDVVRALRQVPGLSLQIEDGWALRPNIGIRGTPTERSSRVTLLEDSVLIAPAPYAAPSAYYFPTFGRLHSVEVLKGPSAITEGPYTIGGAVNLKSTPIPRENSGLLQGEYGSDATWRVHGWYGGGGDRASYLVETHQWSSDGYQSIDRSDRDTGFEKSDYLVKLSVNSDPSAELYQQLDLKLQYSDENSRQSYLGLTDPDFADDPLRRYGLSELDNMDNEHDQVVLSWRIESQAGNGLTVTAYSNNTERAWYKTEGIDFDGSPDPESFQRTSWANVVTAINRGESIAGLSAEQLQAILDGAATAPGSIQLRNNARSYESRGIQAIFDMSLQTANAVHNLQAGLRYHEDEEDRLQRNDSYQQIDGRIRLSARGLEGNAGNRVQDAEAWAAYIYDRIEWDAWTLTPGLRYENINLSRVRYDAGSENPASRDPSNFRDTRQNDVGIWLPGMGVLYEFTPSWRLIAGIHKGFAAPSNEPGVEPEESINYELGFRYDVGRSSLEAIVFFNDYDNLVGICTNSSGSDCEPGDAFNGNGVKIPGLELTFSTAHETGAGWNVPFQLVYTWMDAEFQTDFDSEFFGSVNDGDPVPYVPENQLWASLGLERGDWSFNLSGNYVASVCTKASCGPFEETDSSTTFDAAAHYRLSESLKLYALVENLTDELNIAGREPYGARPNKARTFILGATYRF